jgi:hypothetical protein
MLLSFDSPRRKIRVDEGARTVVVRISQHVAACLRLVRALAVEMRENWIEATLF